MLKVWCDEKWVITEQRWRTLLQEACPQWSPARVALLWQVLDDNNDGKIGMLEINFPLHCQLALPKANLVPRASLDGRKRDAGNWLLRSDVCGLPTCICIECFQSRGQHLCKFFWNKRKRLLKKSVSHRICLEHQHSRVSLFWNTNMVAVTSCENAIFIVNSRLI